VLEYFIQVFLSKVDIPGLALMPIVITITWTATKVEKADEAVAKRPQVLMRYRAPFTSSITHDLDL
jgi:hypothetical protein